jgi:SAM-dependent methyltransferase
MRGPITDPASLYQRRDGLYATDLLIAALAGLDFFTRVGDRAVTLAALAHELNVHVRPADVMTTLFVAMGLLARTGDRVSLTDLAREHLVRSSPWFLGPYFPKIDDRPIAADLLGVLRTGKPASFSGRSHGADWHRAMEREEVAREFIAAMDLRGRLLAGALAARIDLGGARRLLDVGGGSGVYATALVSCLPELRAAVLEKPPVDVIARRAIEDRGFGDRVSVVTADMFSDPWPRDFDVHLMSNVIHDWDEPEVKTLIRASAAALPPGGRLVVHDAFLNHDKSGPLAIAEYSVYLMHSTQGRCYSIREIREWLGESGFDEADGIPTALGRSAVVARRL